MHQDLKDETIDATMFQREQILSAKALRWARGWSVLEQRRKEWAWGAESLERVEVVGGRRLRKSSPWPSAAESSCGVLRKQRQQRALLRG